MKYILVGQTPVPVEDILEWVRWFEAHERRVRVTRVGPYEVWTTFLGLDPQWDSGPPLLFETKVFLPEMLCEVPWSKGKLMGSLDLCERCSTWTQAEAQHERVVKEVGEPGDDIEQLYPVPAEEAIKTK